MFPTKRSPISTAAAPSGPQAELTPSFRFPRQERLKKRTDIQGVFNRGKSVSCSGAKLFFLKNNLSHNRAAFTFPRKFGNAVERNRARRLGKEAYRFLRNGLKPGFDLIVLVYPGTDSLARRMEQLKTLCSRAGLTSTPERSKTGSAGSRAGSIKSMG